jgi:DNA-binding transcriptional ArsR family regulator
MDPRSKAKHHLHFKALSHPRRVRIFELLATDPEQGRSFQSLQEATSIPDSSLVHHLREMEHCGLVHRHREGPHMCFALETSLFVRALAQALRMGEEVRWQGYAS